MAEIIEQSAPTMQEFLTAALNFKSPELRLALGQRPTLKVPTPLVKADRAVFNVPAMTSEAMQTLFRSIASPTQRRQLRRDGRVRFVYVLEAPCGGRNRIGGFRVEAKEVNGRMVLLTCRNLRRDSGRTNEMASAQPE